MSMRDCAKSGIWDLVPCVTRYYNEYWQYYHMREHQHDECEIMYISSGKCRVTIVDSQTGDLVSLTLEAGQYIFIRNGVGHGLYVERDCPCRIRNVEIGFKYSDTLPSLSVLASNKDFKKFFTAMPDYYVIHDDGIFFSCLSLLHELLFEVYPQNEFITEVPNTKIVLSILLLFQRMVEQFHYKYEFTKTSDHYIHKAIKYIMENYENTEKISIGDIAQYVCIAPAYLQRIFKTETGMTIIEYISSIRLEKAKSLLRRTDLSVFDIALNVGYSSRQRLFQLFREKEGISPGQYRKNCREV